MSQNIDMPVSELVIYDSVQPVDSFFLRVKPVDSCWTDILVKLTKVSVLHCYLWKKTKYCIKFNNLWLISLKNTVLLKHI